MSWVPGSHPEERHCQGPCLTSCWRTPGKRIFGLWFIFGYFVNIFSLKKMHEIISEGGLLQNIAEDAPGHPHHRSTGRAEACSPPTPCQASANGLQAESAGQSHVIIWNGHRQRDRTLTKCKEFQESKTWSWPRAFWWNSTLEHEIADRSSPWWWENTFCTSWEGLQVGLGWTMAHWCITPCHVIVINVTCCVVNQTTHHRLKCKLPQRTLWVGVHWQLHRFGLAHLYTLHLAEEGLRGKFRAEDNFRLWKCDSCKTWHSHPWSA